jgi:2-methylcitrate dehydratase PrpD
MMSNLTERLCLSLAELPRAEVSRRGALLARHVWSEFERQLPDDAGAAHIKPAPAAGLLAATAHDGNQTSVETAAFENTLRFASGLDLSDPSAAELASWSVLVFGATALAEAGGASCAQLDYALGLGIETAFRLIESAGPASRPFGFSWQMVAATLGATVAIGTIEGLTAEKLTLALGLSGSTITAACGGNLPVQAAMAAQDSVAMVLLIASGFKAPPDVLACRWGVCDAFAGSRSIDPSKLDQPATAHAPGLKRLLAEPGSARSGSPAVPGTTPVGMFVAGAFNTTAA